MQNLLAGFPRWFPAVGIRRIMLPWDWLLQPPAIETVGGGNRRPIVGTWNDVGRSQGMEIIGYVLAHKDSMGNGSAIRPGDVQRMSAESRIQPSEFNPSPKEAVHFLKSWGQPNVANITRGV